MGSTPTLAFSTMVICLLTEHPNIWCFFASWVDKRAHRSLFGNSLWVSQVSFVKLAIATVSVISRIRFECRILFSFFPTTDCYMICLNLNYLHYARGSTLISSACDTLLHRRVSIRWLCSELSFEASAEGARVSLCSPSSPRGFWAHLHWTILHEATHLSVMKLLAVPLTRTKKGTRRYVWYLCLSPMTSLLWLISKRKNF